MEEPLVQNPVAIFLTVIAVILIAPLIIERFRLPGIVGIIIGGTIIGPYGFNLLSTEYTIETLGIAGLVYLMFSVGLEIDLRQFKRVRNQALVMGLLTFFIPALTGTLLGRWLGYSWNSSVLLGAVIVAALGNIYLRKISKRDLSRLFLGNPDLAEKVYECISELPVRRRKQE